MELVNNIVTEISNKNSKIIENKFQELLATIGININGITKKTLKEMRSRNITMELETVSSGISKYIVLENGKDAAYFLVERPTIENNGVKVQCRIKISDIIKLRGE